MSTFMHQFGRSKSIAKRVSKNYLEEALYKRLLKDGGSEVSIRRNLNEFLKSRKRVYKWESDLSLKILRDRKRYSPALKLSENMTKRGMNKTVSDQARHLDLLAKARGIAAAETYFVDLPEQSKNHLTYGALLNCYCKELMTEKAEALIEKMKELKLALTSMPYNSLMTLYSKTGQLENIPAIIQEMKASEVRPDSYTYNVWMRALAAVNDIYGVERVIDEMKRDGRVSPDWTTYSNLASIYIGAGLNDKAEKALKELEKRNAFKDLSAYQFLITLYGKTGNQLEVYRVWRSLRLAFPKTANISYLNMIQVLVNLKDLRGAEKCFREWVSAGSLQDIRIVNVLIGAYAKAGSLDKAKQLKVVSERRGAKPSARTWEIFLDYYLEHGIRKSAVDCIEKAIETGRRGGGKWVPSSEVVQKLMGQFEQNKDVINAERFVEILKKAVKEVDAEVLESLIRTYAAAGKSSPIMRRRVKMENVELSEEGEKLLDVICVE